MRSVIFLVFALQIGVLFAQQATVINNLQIIAITDATDVITPLTGTAATETQVTIVPTVPAATSSAAPGQGQCTDTCPQCRFQTFSEGQWGDVCSPSSMAGCLLQSGNFSQCFQQGVVVGCAEGFTITINQANIITDLLPASAIECGNDPACPGRTYTLRSSTVNPTSFNEAGHLSGQMISMSLNLGFDRCLAGFSEACAQFESLFLCDTGFFSASRNPPGSFLSCTAFYNMTVRQVFDIGNEVLGGCRSSCENPSLLAPGLSSSGACVRGQDLLNCALMINEGFAGNNILSTAPWFSQTPCPARTAARLVAKQDTIVVAAPTINTPVVVPPPSDPVVVVVAPSATTAFNSATQTATSFSVLVLAAMVLAIFLRN